MIHFLFTNNIPLLLARLGFHTERAHLIPEKSLANYSAQNYNFPFILLFPVRPHSMILTLFFIIILKVAENLLTSLGFKFRLRTLEKLNQEPSGSVLTF